MGTKRRKLKVLLEEEGYLFYKLKTDQTNAPSELFTMERKLRGLAHLLDAYDNEILPAPGDVNAIGLLIFEFCDDLMAIRHFIEPVLWKHKNQDEDKTEE